MVTLQYPPKIEKINIWQDRLEGMIIQYELIPEKELHEPQLRYEEDFIQGVDSIDAYLDMLEDLVKTW
jgi:hypothetical protein